MLKSKIKIAILAIGVSILIIYGLQLYKRLNHDRKVFNLNIISYVSPQTKQFIIINEEYAPEKYSLLNPNLHNILTDFAQQIPYPILYSEYTNGIYLMLAKVKYEQEIAIKNILNETIVPYHPPKEKKYKDALLLSYTLEDGTFIVCTFHKGIFAMSPNYKLIENVIDIDPENTFLSDIENKEVVDETSLKGPISLFLKQNENILVANYSITNDTTYLDGFVVNTKNNSIIDDDNIAYKIVLTDSLCISQLEMDKAKNRAKIRIVINKSP